MTNPGSNLRLETHVVANRLGLTFRHHPVRGACLEDWLAALYGVSLTDARKTLGNMWSKRSLRKFFTRFQQGSNRAYTYWTCSDNFLIYLALHPPVSDKYQAKPHTLTVIQQELNLNAENFNLKNL